MEHNGLFADNISNNMMKEMNRKISFPEVGLFPNNKISDVDQANSEVTILKEGSPDLDEMNADRVRYLLNIDDALIEILI